MFLLFLLLLLSCLPWRKKNIMDLSPRRAPRLTCTVDEGVSRQVRGRLARLGQAAGGGPAGGEDLGDFRGALTAV